MENTPKMVVTTRMLAKAAMTLLRMDKFSNQRIFLSLLQKDGKAIGAGRREDFSGRRRNVSACVGCAG
jgi:hypothetical protein